MGGAPALTMSSTDGALNLAPPPSPSACSTLIDRLEQRVPLRLLVGCLEHVVGVSVGELRLGREDQRAIADGRVLEVVDDDVPGGRDRADVVAVVLDQRLDLRLVD